MPPEHASASGGIELEVLICTHNRRRLLARTLHYLNEAERPRNASVRILVAANACTDDTAAFLDAYGAGAAAAGHLPLAWMPVAIPGKSNALNESIPRLTAEFVAFVDDDHRVDRGFFTGIVTAVAAYPDISLFCGRILPDWDGTEPAWVHDSGPYRVYPLPIPRFDQGDREMVLEPGRVTPGGGNLFMRRRIFPVVGEFATDLGPVGHNLGGAEDIEWVRRALQKGEKLGYIPQVTQYHYVELERLRLGYLMHKAYERTMSMMRLDTGVGAAHVLPAYMVRKLLNYLLKAATSLSGARRRYYLVRTAAAYGELRGFQRRRLEARAGIRRGV